MIFKSKSGCKKGGNMMWKSRWMDREGIIISKYKGRIDKGGLYL